MTEQQRLKHKRNAMIVGMADRGYTPKFIADRFHLHVTGVHRILRDHERKGSGEQEKREQVQSIPAHSVIRG